MLCAVLLSGCGAAVWEDARNETDETAHDVAALRDAAERPRFSAIRVIERRPWLGLAQQDARKEDMLPAGLLEPGAVTVPLAGIGGASVLARRIPSPADEVVGRRQKSRPFRLPKWTIGSAGWKTSDPYMKTYEEW